MKRILLLYLAIQSLHVYAQQLAIDKEKVRIEFLTSAKSTAGTIGGFEGQIVFNPNALEDSRISGSVDVNTLDTGNKLRDKHLKSDDFFDLKNFPRIYFESTSIRKASNSQKSNYRYRMEGVLTIEDSSHNEVIIFTFTDNIFAGEMTVSMTNYDLGLFSKKKGDKSEVTIKFTLPLK
ncbi:YceI family protein [Parvicella tangerina]|uniref:Protein YceI n=1 Tax=Parvicella tangerina TaxID=2829795 RepID=A0A916NJ19_9FLAO|nr:YceI family protein [Parvicella tangerina]CAG5085404.1 Protein YceI [Parvicella tangerina]